MGCNLFWPLTKRRIPGLKLLHASDAAPNFLVVWSALALILLNLDQWGGPGMLPPLPYGLVVMGGPWLALTLGSVYRRLREGADSVVARRALEEAERRAESQDLGFG